MNLPWIFRPGLFVASLSLRALSVAVEHARAASGDGVAGTCAVCGGPVGAGDPHLRFGGRVFHAEPCAERHPPAETAARGARRRTAL
jgi:hypothetical protein